MTSSIDAFDRDWPFFVKSAIEKNVTALNSDISAEQSERYSALIIFGVPDSQTTDKVSVWVINMPYMNTHDPLSSPLPCLWCESRSGQ